MVCNVSWTGSEYKIMRNFIVLALALWLANFKICLKIFFAGLGLGSCSPTVKPLTTESRSHYVTLLW